MGPCPHPLPTIKRIKNDVLKSLSNINDHFALSLSIDLNDRLAFIKHLFDGSVADYEAVISQILTFNSWDEVHDFIAFKVKIEYPHWKEKDAIEDRFMTILKNYFDN